MIKDWKKFNESSNTNVLTEDMLKDIIIFRQYTLSSSKRISDIWKKIDSNEVTKEMMIKYDDDMWSYAETGMGSEYFTNLNKLSSETFKQIKEQEDIKKDLKTIWLSIKEFMGGIPTFSEIEDYLVDIIDDGWELDFEGSISSDFYLKLSYMKITTIEEHIKSYETMKSIIKGLTRPGTHVYLDDYTYRWPQMAGIEQMESVTKIILTNK
jgi:hypothetical protein